MTETYKVLGQSAPAATTLTTLYTVPAATSAVVSSIIVANRSGAAITVRLAIRPAGAAIANQHYLAYDASVPANDSIPFKLGITLATTDVVSVYASDANSSWSAFGTEIA